MFEFYTFDIERFVSRMSICIRIGIGDFPLNCYKLAQRQRATCPGGADDGEFVVAGVLWGYGYCLRQYAFARALSPVGNTRTFVRYRLSAIRARLCAIAYRQYAHVCALSSASIRAHGGAAWAMGALPGEKVPRRFLEGDLGDKFGRAIGGWREGMRLGGGGRRMRRSRRGRRSEREAGE